MLRARAAASTRGPLDGDAIARLFERIIDEARRLERDAKAQTRGHDVTRGPIGPDRLTGGRSETTWSS